jgi:UDP-N-acetylglucosamine 1-carboxyvinyltransferase
MADRYVIEGSIPLKGQVRVEGAKNAVLPMLAASLLCQGTVCLRNCPRLSDVDSMLCILRWMGCEIVWEGNDLKVNASGAQLNDLPQDIARVMRSSIFLLGPMLGRFGQAVCGYPGGCNIGQRPIDLHLKGLRAMGVEIREEAERVISLPSSLTGTELSLDFPSVGATENLMMAAVAAEGATVITGAAREPEVVALMDMLNAMGAKVEGAGGDVIRVQGVPRDSLHSCTVDVIGDRIVAGTYLIAAAITGGEVEVQGVDPEYVCVLCDMLSKTGCEIYMGTDFIHLTAPRQLTAIGRVETRPYPGFATDLQAPWFALCALAQGESQIAERIFERRFHHAQELARMGARVRLEGNEAFIEGVDHLHGARVWAQDLRGGAALVLAALAAQGESIVENIHYIDRGYQHLEQTLRNLGARIERQL